MSQTIYNKNITNKKKAKLLVLIMLVATIVLSVFMATTLIQTATGRTYFALPTLDEYEEYYGFKQQEFVTFSEFENTYWNKTTKAFTEPQNDTYLYYNMAMRIDTAEELLTLSYYMNGRREVGASSTSSASDAAKNYYRKQTYFLGSNIDFSTASRGLISMGSAGAPFEGKFYGQGFTIYNLYYELDANFISPSDYLGLFSYVENGVISGLSISYSNVVLPNSGGLSAFDMEGVYKAEADNTGATDGNNRFNSINKKRFGGLVGYAKSSNIRYSYVWFDIEQNDEELKFTNKASFAGLVNELDGTTLEFCYFAGKGAHSTSTSYKNGNVSPVVYQSSSLDNSKLQVYYDSTIYVGAVSASDSSTPLTTAQLKSKHDASGLEILNYRLNGNITDKQKSRFGEEPSTGNMFYNSQLDDKFAGVSYYPMLRGFIRGSLFNLPTVKSGDLFLQKPSDLFFMSEAISASTSASQADIYLLYDLDMTQTYEKGYVTPSKIFSGTFTGKIIENVNDIRQQSKFLNSTKTVYNNAIVLNDSRAIVGLWVQNASFINDPSYPLYDNMKLYLGLFGRVYRSLTASVAVDTIDNINLIGGGVVVNDYTITRLYDNNGLDITFLQDKYKNFEYYVGHLVANIEIYGNTRTGYPVQNVHSSGNVVFKIPEDLNVEDNPLQLAYKNVIGGVIGKATFRNFVASKVQYISYSGIIYAQNTLSIGGNQIYTDSGTSELTPAEKESFDFNMGGVFGIFESINPSRSGGLSPYDITNFGIIYSNRFVGGYYDSVLVSRTTYLYITSVVGGVAGFASFDDYSSSINKIYNYGNIYTRPEYFTRQSSLIFTAYASKNISDYGYTAKTHSSEYYGGLFGGVKFRQQFNLTSVNELENYGDTYFIEENYLSSSSYYNSNDTHYYIGGLIGNIYVGPEILNENIVSGQFINGGLYTINPYIETSARNTVTSFNKTYRFYYGGFASVVGQMIVFDNLSLSHIEYDLEFKNGTIYFNGFTSHGGIFHNTDSVFELSINKNTEVLKRGDITVSGFSYRINMHRTSYTSTQWDKKTLQYKNSNSKFTFNYSRIGIMTTNTVNVVGFSYLLDAYGTTNPIQFINNISDFVYNHNASKVGTLRVMGIAYILDAVVISDSQNNTSLILNDKDISGAVFFYGSIQSLQTIYYANYKSAINKFTNYGKLIINNLKNTTTSSSIYFYGVLATSNNSYSTKEVSYLTNYGDLLLSNMTGVYGLNVRYYGVAQSAYRLINSINYGNLSVSNVSSSCLVEYFGVSQTALFFESIINNGNVYLDNLKSISQCNIYMISYYINPYYNYSSNIINNGDIDVVDSVIQSLFITGGIRLIQDSSNVSYFNLYQCVNNGDINVENTTIQTSLTISGVLYTAGENQVGQIVKTVYDFINLGNINVDIKVNDNYNALIDISGVHGVLPIKTSDMLNAGDITLNIAGKTYPTIYIGGVTSNQDRTASSSINMLNYVNIGDITVSNNCEYNTYIKPQDYIYSMYIGGVAGRLNQNISLEQAINFGKMSYTSGVNAKCDVFIGGIVGAMGNITATTIYTASIDSVVNYGDINVVNGNTDLNQKNVAVGGILGYSFDNSILKNTVNYGKIIGQNLDASIEPIKVGGIVGSVKDATILGSFRYVLYVYQTGGTPNVSGNSNSSLFPADLSKVGTTYSGADSLSINSYTESTAANGIYNDNFFMIKDDKDIKFDEAEFLTQRVVKSSYGIDKSSQNWSDIGEDWTQKLLSTGTNTADGKPRKYIYAVASNREKGRYISINFNSDAFAAKSLDANFTAIYQKVLRVIDYADQVYFGEEALLNSITIQEINGKATNIEGLRYYDHTTNEQIYILHLLEENTYGTPKPTSFNFKEYIYDISDNCTLTILPVSLNLDITASTSTRYTVTVTNNNTGETNKYILELRYTSKIEKKITIANIEINQGDGTRLVVNSTDLDIGASTGAGTTASPTTWRVDLSNTADYNLINDTALSTTLTEENKIRYSGFLINFNTHGVKENATIAAQLEFDQTRSVYPWANSITYGTTLNHSLVVQRGEFDTEPFPSPGYITADIFMANTDTYNRYYPPGGYYNYILTYTYTEGTQTFAIKLIITFFREYSDESKIFNPRGYSYDYLYNRIESKTTTIKIASYIYNDTPSNLTAVYGLDSYGNINANYAIAYGTMDFLNITTTKSDITAILKYDYSFHPHAKLNKNDYSVDIEYLPSSTLYQKRYIIKFSITAENQDVRYYSIYFYEKNPIVLMNKVIKTDNGGNTSNVSNISDIKLTKQEKGKIIYSVYYNNTLDKIVYYPNTLVPNPTQITYMRNQPYTYEIYRKKSDDTWEDVTGSANLPTIEEEPATTGYNGSLIRVVFNSTTLGGQYKIRIKYTVAQADSWKVYPNGVEKIIPGRPNDESYYLDDILIEKIASKLSYAIKVQTYAKFSSYTFEYKNASDVYKTGASIALDRSVVYVAEIDEKIDIKRKTPAFYLSYKALSDNEATDPNMFDSSSQIEFTPPEDAALWIFADPSDPFPSLQLTDNSGNWINPLPEIKFNEETVFRIYAEDAGYYTDYHVTIEGAPAIKTIQVEYNVPTNFAGFVALELQRYFMIEDSITGIKAPVTTRLFTADFNPALAEVQGLVYYQKIKLRKTVSAFYAVSIDISPGYEYTIEYGGENSSLLDPADSPFPDSDVLDLSDAASASTTFIKVTVKQKDMPWGLYDTDVF